MDNNVNTADLYFATSMLTHQIYKCVCMGVLVIGWMLFARHLFPISNPPFREKGIGHSRDIIDEREVDA